MQAISPAGAHNPNAHTQDEILDALRGVSGGRRLSFRYELWDAAGALIAPLDGVEGCTVEQNWLADVKRTAKFRIRDLGQIDYLSQRIKPWVRLHLPPYGALDYAEWPQGMFVLSSPDRSDSPAGVVTREVQAFDLTRLPLRRKVPGRYAVAAGTLVTAAVGALLPDIPLRVVASTATLPVAREWEPGTSVLAIVNDLLGMINYESLSVDEDGFGQVRPYVAPPDRPEEYAYVDDDVSVIVPGMRQHADLDVANQWVLVVSEPDRAPLVATYTNNDPGSPTSTVRRGGQIITDHRVEVEAVNLATLQAKAARLAFEASQVYEITEFSTALMPIHSGNDVYRITYSPLAINARYAEQSWSMELRAGAHMTHRARRVVTV